MAETSSAVVVADRASQQQALDRITQIGDWTPEQVRLAKNTVAKGATDDELRLLFAVAGRTGLDPFTKQIHFVKRWDSKLKAEVGAFQIGIDGFRVIAQRSKHYLGRVGPFWCGVDGEWKDVWLKDYPPTACKVGIKRKGYDDIQWNTVRFKSFVQTKQDGTPNRFWAGMDAEQLAKCAEAGGLRATFPHDMSGLYLHEEMEQADTPEPTTPKATPVEIVTTALGIGTTDADPTATETQAEAEPAIIGEMYGDKAQEVESLATTGEDVQRDQMRDRDYLLALCRDLEKAWKKAASVAKESPAGSGNLWFINRDLLLECGHVDGSGAAVPMAFYDCNDESRRIGPEQCYSLCVAVQSAIDTHNNKGRKTRAVHPNEA